MRTATLMGRAVLLAAGTAMAQPTEPPPPPEPATATPGAQGHVALDVTTPPLAAPRPGVHTHDGFYFRAGTGLGVMTEDLRSESSSVYGGKVKGNGTGFSTVSELAFGGTIARGFVLGGGIYSAELVSATFRVTKDSAGMPPPELDPERRNFTLVGPFIDWYFNEHRGLHVQFALGFASLSAVRIGSVPWEEDHPYNAAGGGVMLGLGYEWWIGEEWSMGVLARITGAYLSGKDDAGVRWYHGLGTGPSPMFTLTYH